MFKIHVVSSHILKTESILIYGSVITKVQNLISAGSFDFILVSFILNIKHWFLLTNSSVDIAFLNGNKKEETKKRTFQSFLTTPLSRQKGLSSPCIAKTVPESTGWVHVEMSLASWRITLSFSVCFPLEQTWKDAISAFFKIYFSSPHRNLRTRISGNVKRSFGSSG